MYDLSFEESEDGNSYSFMSLERKNLFRTIFIANLTSTEMSFYLIKKIIKSRFIMYNNSNLTSSFLRSHSFPSLRLSLLVEQDEALRNDIFEDFLLMSFWDQCIF